GEEVEVPINELVPGDMIKLAAGDMIPADIRILSSKDLFISQASMTGESEPVEKFGKELETVSVMSQSILELENLAFM
ncbi:heavy metal translocating P-type ATPase, partial [Casaltella massiliensis]|nr:heavy metal translocating P-type ATPase [Casaltella massiliensis]